MRRDALARRGSGATGAGWLDKTREAWEQTANRALEQAGHGEQIDRRSLAARHRGVGGAALQEKLQKAARADFMQVLSLGSLRIAVRWNTDNGDIASIRESRFRT